MVLKVCNNMTQGQTEGRVVATTSGILTPEQLATFWAVALTGRAPSAEQTQRAKQRVEQRGLDFMRQTQFEMDVLSIMADDDRRTISRAKRRRGNKVLHCLNKTNTNRICAKHL